MLAFLALGTALGTAAGWSLDVSVYFAIATLTTVGYGDFTLASTCAWCDCNSAPCMEGVAVFLHRFSNI